MGEREIRLRPPASTLPHLTGMNVVAYLVLLLLTSLVTSRPIDDIDLPDATDLPVLLNLNDGKELALELEEKEEDVSNASTKDDARKSKEEEQRSIGAVRGGGGEGGEGEVEREEREEEEKVEPISMEDLDLDRRIEDIQGFEETGVSEQRPREIVAFIPNAKVETDRMEQEKEQITHKNMDTDLERDSASDIAAQLIPGGSSIETPETDWAALLAWAAFLPRFEEKQNEQFPVLIATQPDWQNRMDEIVGDRREKVDREDYLGGAGGPGPEGPREQMRESSAHSGTEERHGMDMDMLNERRRLEAMAMAREQSSSPDSQDSLSRDGAHSPGSGAGVIDLKTFLPGKPGETAAPSTAQPERRDPVDSHHYLSNNKAAGESAPSSQFGSILAGIKCALRDCRDAMPFRPTPPPRPLEDRFIIRKARS